MHSCKVVSNDVAHEPNAESGYGQLLYQEERRYDVTANVTASRWNHLGGYGEAHRYDRAHRLVYAYEGVPMQGGQLDYFADPASNAEWIHSGDPPVHCACEQRACAAGSKCMTHMAPIALKPTCRTTTSQYYGRLLRVRLLADADVTAGPQGTLSAANRKVGLPIVTVCLLVLVCVAVALAADFWTGFLGSLRVPVLLSAVLFGIAVLSTAPQSVHWELSRDSGLVFRHLWFGWKVFEARQLRIGGAVIELCGIQLSTQRRDEPYPGIAITYDGLRGAPSTLVLSWRSRKEKYRVQAQFELMCQTIAGWK